MRDFNHTVNVLVNAYMNDKLQHGICDACAVGNIVMACCNKPGRIDLCNGWPTVFVTGGNHQQKRMPIFYEGEAKRQIDATGYTWQELARIEKAFEFHDTDSFDPEDADEAMFNGLMAVVDVLADIHGIDLTVREEAKALFVKA
jgi:hypothetical protein